MGMPPVLDKDLGWTLGMTFRQYVKVAEDAFRGIPGGARGYQVLAHAVNETPEPIGALALRLGIDKSVMTYLVDALVEEDMVERRQLPGGDRRNKQVAGTVYGASIWRKAQKTLRGCEDHLLAPLAPAEREAFREMLRKVALHAHAHDPVDDACQLVEALHRDEARQKRRVKVAAGNHGRRPS